MHYFVNSVESKAYRLSKQSAYMAVSNIRLVFFYCNTDGSANFMPARELEEGFYRTLVHFPHMTGYLKQTGYDTMDIIVDKTKLNMPDYRESQSDIHYQDIESANFDPATWPSDLLPVSDFVCPEKDTNLIKLANFHVVRLKENSGIAISQNINHGIVDVYSAAEVLNRWAEETRALLTGVPAKPPNYCLDDRISLKYLPSERTEIGDEIRRHYSERKSLLTDWLKWLSPNSRGKVLNYVSSRQPLRTHLFRVRREKLDELRLELLEHVPPGTRLSDHDILCAIGYKLNGQATYDAASKTQSWLDKLLGYKPGTTGDHCILIPHDIRHRLGMEHLNCIGNPLQGMIEVLPVGYAQSPTTNQSIAEMAYRIRKITDSVTPESIGTVMDIIERDTCDIGTFLSGMKFDVHTVVANLTRIKLYDANFGSGVQAFSTLCPPFVMGTFAFMPSPPSSTDTIIFVTNSPDVMDGILSNTFWKDFATMMF
ncbi:hypothetical protein EC988_000534 [Linderina pennispora]|nr:hypothetical protein EC988_000534 [Linderina pennispora]